MAKILIVDDMEDIRRALTKILQKEGHEILTAGNGREGIQAVKDHAPDLVFMDIRMPIMSGLDALAEIRKFDTDTPVVVLTAYLDAEYVTRAIRLGAYQYLVKPSKPSEVVSLVRQAIRARRRGPPVEAVKVFGDMIGTAPKMQEIFDLILKISHADVTVLIEGESGTGKELVARAIHQNSLRKGEAYVTVDCGTLPDTLMESEIFGYEAGAFTDARKAKPGRFELAHGGTLFLDEIGNLAPSAQVKLLRALEDKMITRLGGKQAKEVDVRIIAASNMDLTKACTTGRFREDLYYRLNVFKMSLPRLRDRTEDILPLANHFIERFAREQRRTKPNLSDEAVGFLMRSPWRGNVRELRNVMERATLLAGDTILPEHLSQEILEDMGPGAGKPGAAGSPAQVVQAVLDSNLSLKEAKKAAMEGIEKHYILGALGKTGWNKSEAAKMLDLNYKTLREKIKEYGLEKD